MPVPLSGRRIFLASPGGFESTRQLVRDVVAEFNTIHGYRQGVVFIVVGFEDLPKGLGRPQARINPQVETSDYLLMVVGDRLGSPTTPTPPFQTGIEEELSVAARACDDAASPMVDMLLLFRAPTDSELIKPSKELAEVLLFRHNIEASKELEHSPYSTNDEFRYRLNIQLQDWAQLDGGKTPRSYPRLLSALNHTKVEPMSTPPSNDAAELVAWAEAEAAEGHVTVANEAFARAALQGEPDHLLRYARFLQGTGQFERALQLDRRVLTLDSVIGNNSPEAVGHRTAALANIGLLKRRQGDLTGARRTLREAVEIGTAFEGEQPRALSYALDQLGLVETRLGHRLAAADAFAQALALRQANGDKSGEAQSLVNLARVSHQSGDEPAAIKQLDRAIELLEQDGDQRVLANAVSSLGRLLIRSDPARARTLLDRSLEINERLEIPDGESVARSGLVDLALDQGEVEVALHHAQQILDLANDKGNREGATVALRLIGQIRCISQEWDQARSALEQSVQMAVNHGDPGREASARLWLARAFRGLGEIEAAAESIEAGLTAAVAASDAQTESELRSLAVEISS